MEIDDVQPANPSPHSENDIDLVNFNSPKTDVGEEIAMLRMFRRFLRNGSRPRVVGGWSV